MAKKGYEVFAVDYIKAALNIGQRIARSQKLDGKVCFKNQEIDSPWPFADGFFEVAIDSFSSIDIETLEGRQRCRDEMFRTLKPGGYAFVNVVSNDDEWEKELIKQSPGAEPNSTIWPQNGKFQKDYDEDELKKFYEKFDFIELRKLSKPAFKLGKSYTATNLWLVVRKPT